MVPFRLFAATGDVVTRLESTDSIALQTSIMLGNEHQSRDGHIVNGVMCTIAARSGRYPHVCPTHALAGL